MLEAIVPRPPLIKEKRWENKVFLSEKVETTNNSTQTTYSKKNTLIKR